MKEPSLNSSFMVCCSHPGMGWLRENIPTEDDIIWGEHITDCGESTGHSIDKDRNMPLCAEVEIKDKSQLIGYLTLFVGTRDGGFFQDSTSTGPFSHPDSQIEAAVLPVKPLHPLTAILKIGSHLDDWSFVTTGN